MGHPDASALTPDERLKTLITPELERLMGQSLTSQATTDSPMLTLHSSQLIDSPLSSTTLFTQVARRHAVRLCAPAHSHNTRTVAAHNLSGCRASLRTALGSHDGSAFHTDDARPPSLGRRWLGRRASALSRRGQALAGQDHSKARSRDRPPSATGLSRVPLSTRSTCPKACGSGPRRSSPARVNSPRASTPQSASSPTGAVAMLSLVQRTLS